MKNIPGTKNLNGRIESIYDPPKIKFIAESAIKKDAKQPKNMTNATPVNTLFVKNLDFSPSIEDTLGKNTIAIVVGTRSRTSATFEDME